MQPMPQPQPTGKSLSQAKMLGGIGSILTLLLFVPNGIGAILVIVGWILILLAVRDISESVHDPSIFKDAIIGAVMQIIGVVAFAVIVGGAILALIGLGSTTTTSTTTPPTGVIALIGAILVGLAIAWVFGIISSVFIRRSYKSITMRTNVGTFGTAGTLYLVGAILEIILVGFLLNFIAQILSIVAFFSLPDYPTQTGMMPPPMQPQGMGPPPQ